MGSGDQRKGQLHKPGRKGRLPSRFSQKKRGKGGKDVWARPQMTEEVDVDPATRVNAISLVSRREAEVENK